MALIKCSECGKDVSEIAATCPHCGAPVVSDIKTHAEKAASNNYIASLMFFGGGAWLAFDAFVHGKEAFARDFKWAGGAMALGAIYYILAEFARNIDARRLKKKRKCETVNSE